MMYSYIPYTKQYLNASIIVFIKYILNINYIFMLTYDKKLERLFCFKQKGFYSWWKSQFITSGPNIFDLGTILFHSNHVKAFFCIVLWIVQYSMPHKNRSLWRNCWHLKTMAKRKTNGTSKNETIRTTDMCVPRYFHSLLINHGTYQNIKRKTRFDCGGGKYHKQ